MHTSNTRATGPVATLRTRVEGGLVALGLVSLLTTAALTAPAQAGGATGWSYPAGESWGTTCEAPTAQQSPIDFSGVATTATTMAALPLMPPAFSTSDQNVIFNNGVHVAPALGGNAAITYAPTTLHFHAQSEHILQGKAREPLEVHIKGTHGGQTVVFAALFKQGGTATDPGTTFLQKGVSAIQKGTTLDPSAVLQMFYTEGIYSYTGSLTTPPCSTPVNFYVLNKAIPVETSTLDAFVAALNTAGMPAKNYRPIQPLLSTTTVYVRESPPPPTNLKVGTVTATSIEITYDAAPGATQYVPQWRVAGAGGPPNLCAVTTGLKGICTGLLPNASYDLTVTASNANGGSRTSAGVTAKTKK